MALAFVRPFGGSCLGHKVASASSAASAWSFRTLRSTATAPVCGARRPVQLRDVPTLLQRPLALAQQRLLQCASWRQAGAPPSLCSGGGVRQMSSRPGPGPGPRAPRAPNRGSAGPLSSSWPAVPSSQASAVAGPQVGQTRGAGRALGLKRKRRNNRPRTVWQKGLGKRMEFFWPKRAHRTRVPMYENSRRHLIWDHHLRRWLVMWYREGNQVFRQFPARGNRFERSRARAMIFFKQLQLAGKLGRPKPDACRSGVRGVFYDKQEHSWVARWNDSGLQKYAVYSTQDMGFSEAYREAVRTRVTTVRQNHQFVMQRTRWKGFRRPLGTPHT